MDLTVRSDNGAAAGSLAVSDEVFGAEFKPGLIHQVVTAYLNASRAGTKAQKTRAQVSGGNSKPFRQKGTGRARAGTTRGPLWRTGGRAFAAVPRDYSQKVNRKMYRGAVRSIVSELVRQERLVILPELALAAPKTKELLAKLGALNLTDVLILTDDLDANLYYAARNLPGVDVLTAREVDPASLVAFEHVLTTEAAVRQLEERLA
jgi:large subunit ribosomal protein L4